ncbi:MAG TPA: polysaccharide biosynthesis C-terminal domain-containing protein [Rhizomicrobium sp.]|jgi:O-antigen/teichoic acid export membrane protein|nr:polysaccharide biosynthesis C-terminal domain-containing protein [Rhizomicrobium sp.]
MSEPKGKIFANALHYMAGQGAMAVFGLVSSIVLARYLPKTVFGQYFYFLTLAILFLPILDGGGHTLYAVLGARDRSRIGVSWARAIAVKLYALPVLALLMAGYFLWSPPHTLDSLFVLLLLYTIAQSLLQSTDVAFRPAEQGRSWAIRRVVYESSSFFLILIAVLFFHVQRVPTLLALATIAICVAVIWAVSTVVTLTGLTRAQFVNALKTPFDRAEIRALWPFAINTALWVIYYRETNVFLEKLGAHAKDDLADFRVAFVIMTSALYIPRALIWASVPRIALHDEQDNREQFRALVRQTSGVNTFLASFFTLGGLLYGERLIGLVYGPKYAHLGLAWTLFDLVLGLLFVQQFCTDLLNGIRQERFVVYSLMVGITILTALSFFLVPRYGTVGAAAAQLGAGAIMVPMNLRVLARRVGLENLHGVSLIRLALALAAAAAVGYLLLRLNYYLSLAGFLATALAASYGFGALPEQFARFADRAVATAFRRMGLQ